MMPAYEALARFEALQADVDVAVALAKSMLAHAETCKTRGYRISPSGLKIYAERIVEVLCASKKQKEDQG